jgi:hypothetical protein
VFLLIKTQSDFTLEINKSTSRTLVIKRNAQEQKTSKQLYEVNKKDFRKDLDEPTIRALRGAGPLRLRREKRALKRSEIGWAGSPSRSHKNFSISGEQPKELRTSPSPSFEESMEFATQSSAFVGAACFSTSISENRMRKKREGQNYLFSLELFRDMSKLC